MVAIRRGAHASSRAVFDVPPKTLVLRMGELKSCIRRDAGHHTRDGCAPRLRAYPFTVASVPNGNLGKQIKALLGCIRVLIEHCGV
jgi:hypothetical protein